MASRACMNTNFLDFEQPIAELRAKIEELRLISSDQNMNLVDELANLQTKCTDLTRSIFSNLTPWQMIQLARHPQRPYTLDYISRIFTEFDELHGDRVFGDDHAIVGGVARLLDKPVMVIGQQKGRDTKEKLYRNFGMPHPEGYRRAKRLMEMAEKFKLPVITFIDTPGAYPGVGAEARGQSEAIARNLWLMSQLKTPIVCVVIGEGCSGGALGMGMGDKVMVLQYSYYATISPEGCATILWKSAAKAPIAAEIMGIIPEKLLALGLIDEIIPEPLGGAHRNVDAMAKTLQSHLVDTLADLGQYSTDALLARRYERLMALE